MSQPLHLMRIALRDTRNEQFMSGGIDGVSAPTPGRAQQRIQRYMRRRRALPKLRRRAMCCERPPNGLLQRSVPAPRMVVGAHAYRPGLLREPLSDRHAAHDQAQRLDDALAARGTADPAGMAAPQAIRRRSLIAFTRTFAGSSRVITSRRSTRERAAATSMSLAGT